MTVTLTDVKTLLEPAVELTVSNLVESQFPEVFKEIGPVFVEFVKEYYQFLESYKQPLWYARRWPQLNDIDETIDDFLIYFKKKFLHGIQLETTSDVRTMIKHSLDIYRSKGSPQSIDLLFRLVFGVGAEVYFPRTDLLQPSSGTWVVPKYLEVSPRPNMDNKKFVGQQIVGSQSQATAFVDRMIRRNINGVFDEILYISAINGSFITGEKINFTPHTDSPTVDFKDCPTVIGSLSDVIVTDGSLGYSVGDRVRISGVKGVGAIGRISALQTTLGLVTYTLLDGGWGYTTQDTEQLFSNTTLRVNSVQAPNTYSSNYYFKFLDYVVQPWAQINYLNANGTINVGDFIFNYFANGAQAGKGQVLSINSVNSTSGNASISILSGTMTNLAFYTTTNAVGANLNVANSYTDMTASGYAVSEWANVYLLVSNSTGQFTNGEIIQSSTGSNAVIASVSIQGSAGQIILQNCYSFFANNMTVTGLLSGTQATITQVSIFLGLNSTNGTFTTLPNNYIYSTISQTNGTVNSVSTGAGSTVNVQTALTNIEVANVSCELITAIGNTLISAPNNWGWSNASANGGSNVTVVVNSSFINVGSLSALTNENPGSNYNFPPRMRPFEPCVTALARRGWTLNFNGATGSFEVGDIVTQSSTNSTGKIIFANNNTLLLERYKLYSNFANTTNTSSQIVGSLSGTTANVTATGIDWTTPEYDMGSMWSGLNALIASNTTSSNGSVSAIQILDSGFVFQANETITFTKDDINVGSGLAQLGRYGIGLGFYKDENGFLSSNKKLFDGDYWQYMSYEIRSSLSIDRYETLLKQLLHVAGMKYFGALYYFNNTPMTLDGVNQGISIVPPDNNAWLDQEDSQWFFFFN